MPRTDGADLIPEVIIKLQELLEGRKVFPLILFTNIRVPVLHFGTKDAGAMQYIERLADISRHCIGSEHFPHPGRPAAMGARHENGSQPLLSHNHSPSIGTATMEFTPYKAAAQRFNR